jgi:tubulin alpha
LPPLSQLAKEIVDFFLDYFMNLAENYTIGLQGFLVFNAVGGGTCYGLGSLLLEQLFVDCGINYKLEFTCVSSLSH